jgi:hypothetical protein
LGTNVKLPFLSVLGTDERGILADAQRLSDLPFYDVMVHLYDRLARVIEEMITHQKILLVERQLDRVSYFNVGKMFLSGV